MQSDGNDSYRRLPWGVLLILSILPAFGCALGARNLDLTRQKYNEANAKTNREELLLNLVRLRYSDTPNMLSIGSIASQNAWDYSLTASGDVGNDAKDILSLVGRAAWSERPTVSYVPMSGADVRGLLNPLSTESLFVLTYTGSPPGQIMSSVVRSMNNVPNAVGAGGPTPDYPPEYAEFAELIDNIRALRSRNQLEIGRVDKLTPIHGPIAVDSLSASEFRAANDSSYVFEPTENDKDKVTLKKKEQATVLRVAPEALGSPEHQEIVRILNLNPALTEYELVLALEGQLQQRPTSAQGHDKIHVTIRSLLQVMFYLAKGVDVPIAHQKKGHVKLTIDADGCPFDWQNVLRGSFRVRHSRIRPLHAAVAVKYRGFWFYIDDRDHVSKTAFFQLKKMTVLEVRGGGAEGLPVLTLPVGGP